MKNDEKQRKGEDRRDTERTVKKENAILTTLVPHNVNSLSKEAWQQKLSISGL